MSTPTKDTIHAAALAAHTAIKDAANLAFITAADIVIAEQEAQGHFRVELPCKRPASMLDISTHYRDLGYFVKFEECSGWNFINGAWPGVWTYPYTSWHHHHLVCNCKNGCKLMISWK